MPKLLLYLSIILLFSCEGDIYVYFSWTDMTPHNASNLSEFPELYEGDSINAAIYCIQLDMHTESSESEGRYYDTEHPPINRKPLEELTITSSAAFNDTLPAGANLTSLFSILNGSYFHSLPADGSNGYDINSQYAHDFRSSPSVEVINLLLLHPPTPGNVHSFEVKCTLEGGVVHSGTTPPIKLN